MYTMCVQLLKKQRASTLDSTCKYRCKSYVYIYMTLHLPIMVRLTILLDVGIKLQFTTVLVNEICERLYITGWGRS